MLKVRIHDDSLNQEVRHRIASRALVIRGNKVAILYSKKYDFYLTPGGGVEEGETLEEACIREAKEEAGLLVKPIKQIAVLDTNYPRVKIQHNYFICELISENNGTEHTTQEEDQNLELKWMTLPQVKHAFSTHSELIKYDAWMQREYVVLCELRNYLK